MAVSCGYFYVLLSLTLNSGIMYYTCSIVGVRAVCY